MKRLAINLTICLASFAVGVATASFLTWIKQPVTIHQPTSQVNRAPIKEQPPATVIAEPEPVREVVFGVDRLRIVPAELNLKSGRLHYNIGVTYPEIVGSNASHIRRLNKRIEQLVTAQYQWPLNPSKADFRYYRTKGPEVFNSVYLDYEITLANDDVLSIYFNGDSYGIGAAHSVRFSLVVNYDLTLRKELKLSDLFKPRSKYLEFIAEYCGTRLSARSSYPVELNPSPASFESWNITDDGIRFNFDACTVMACAGGSQAVEIPFADLKELLR